MGDLDGLGIVITGGSGDIGAAMGVEVCEGTAHLRLLESLDG